MPRIRHQVPSIFNLSMVDVLCCALGCVILLWLINLREAKQRSVTAGQTHAELLQTRAQLDESTSSLVALTTAEHEMRDELGRVRTRAESAERERSVEHERQVLTQAALDKLQADYSATQERLLKKTAQLADRTKSSEAEQQRLLELQTLSREREAKLTDLTRAAEDLKRTVREQRAQLDDAGRSVASMETGKTTLGRELAQTQATLDLMRREKIQLADQVLKAREAADHRFAGITLTGRRVLFLVDMSGSMESIDENTPAPDKWKSVCETLAKVMRSLPQLEQFQVIVFAEAAAYPLGKDGEWLPYEPTSADRTLAALLAVKPKGGTNLYAAFEAAFRLRHKGLDTIYLFSDGLPNVGAGLTAVQERTLKETEKGSILGTLVRRTLKNDWNRDLPGQARVRINTIGFFYESPDVGAFLWALAREHEGSFVGMSRP